MFEMQFGITDIQDITMDFSMEMSYNGPLAIAGEIVLQPDEFRLYNAYPNPFNPQTNIQIDLQNPQRVQVYIYDIKGQMVKTLVNRHLVAGQHVFTWKGKNYQGHSVSTGTYFVRIIGKSQERWQKVTLLK